MNRFYEAFIIKPGRKVDLSRRNPDETFDFKDKEAALELLAKNNHRIARLQNDLYSEGKQSLLHRPARHRTPAARTERSTTCFQP